MEKGINRCSKIFSKNVTKSHYTRIDSKNKKKWNAVEFDRVISGAHLCGMAEAMQFIMISINDLVNNCDIEGDEKLKLILGDIETMYIDASKEFKKDKGYRVNTRFCTDITTLKEEMPKWGLSSEEKTYREEIRNN